MFDYINAGVPILVSDLPLLKELILTYRVGEYLPDRNPEVLAKIIRQMISNKTVYLKAISDAKKELNWDNEKKIFIEFINNIE